MPLSVYGRVALPPSVRQVVAGRSIWRYNAGALVRQEKFTGSRRRVLALTLAAVGLLGVVPAVAAAVPTSSVSMFSDTGEYVGGGLTRLYVAPTDPVSVSGNTSGFTVQAGPLGPGFSFRFEPPEGQTLTAGVYDHAARPTIFKNPQRPGLDIYGNGAGCNELNGRFEIRDISTDSSGAISRLWLLYEHHCEHHVPALFGEIRINEAFVQSFAPPVPAVVRWPPADLGRNGRNATIRVFADRTAKFTRTIVAGGDAASFPVRQDDCNGHSLAVGDTCDMRIGFTPSTPGEHSATLHLEDATGGDYPAILQGFAYGGTTRVVLHSDAGDFVGAGKDWSYTPADAIIEAHGSGRFVSFSVNRDWNALLRPGQDETFAAGTTYTDSELAPGDGPSLDVSGDGRGCNEAIGQFTVSEALFDVDGPLRFGASFEQHCEGATAALRGNLDFRVGDDTTPAQWMTTRSGATPLPFTTAHAQPSTGPCSGRRFADARVILGTSGDDTLYGTNAMEILVGGDGKDGIGGRDGDDCLDGGLGADRLFGGAGNDLLSAGKGDDTVFGGPGQDKFKCGTGDDTVYAEPGETVDADCEHVNR
jgi:hypothetical protein